MTYVSGEPIKMSECSVEYYDTSEECDYDGDSCHSYWCSKCSKIRAVDEPDFVSALRAKDRLKLVDGEYLRLSNMEDKELFDEFKREFRIRGNNISRAEKIKRLVWYFALSNKPPEQYKQAREMYNEEVLKWKVTTPPEPDLEDVVDHIITSLQRTDRGEAKLESDLKRALQTASRKEINKCVQKLARLRIGLLRYGARNFYEKCFELLK